MSEKTIRIGVIGVGAIATGTHIPGIKRSDGGMLSAICDIDTRKLQSAAKAYEIDEKHCFTDYRQLISCPDVDAVDICTPNDMHVEIALAAVNAGKPFSVEKPLSINAPSAVSLDRSVAERGIPSMICFSYRYRPAAVYLRDLIAGGKFGKIRHIYTRYLQAWGNPKNDCPCVWRFKADKSGSGALGDLGSHMIDLVRFITGEEYSEFQAKNGTFTALRKKLDSDSGEMDNVDVDDFSHFFAATTNGIAASFEISRNCFGRGNYQRMEVYGDGGAAVYEQEQDATLSLCIEPDQFRNNRFDRVPIPEKYLGINQMQAFVDMIRGNRIPSCAAVKDGFINQVYLDAVLESAKTGRPAYPALSV